MGLAGLDINGLGGDGLAVPWIGGAQLDPLLEVGHDRRGQLGLRWHLEPVVFQRRHQQALLGLSRYHPGAGFSSLADPRPRVDLEPTLEHLVRGRLGRVTLVAVADQHRADLRFKEVQSLAIGGRLVGGRGGGGQKQSDENRADGCHPGHPCFGGGEQRREISRIPNNNELVDRLGPGSPTRQPIGVSSRNLWIVRIRPNSR